MSETSLTHHACIALGANLGARIVSLQQAVAKLSGRSDIKVEKVSGYVETEAVGGPPDQPRYLNAAALLSTSLTPRKLLRVLLTIERELGRERQPGERNAPRTIDLDLLLFDQRVVNEPGLQVPHPRMHERAFVLQPLVEIAPDAVHPVLNKTARELLEEIQK